MKKLITSLSIVIPVYNEEESLPLLYENLVSTLTTIDYDYEIIYVDDGSHDASFALLEQLAQQDTQVKVIKFTRNYGQTAALAAGIDHAQKEAVIFLDADLQNDPSDIPMMLTKLNEGYDIVSGWRKQRQDHWLTRILPSQIANWIISKVTKVHLHDYGCTLKIYRREVLQGYRLYGEMHRFLPAYAAQVGARIVEVPVKHHPRRHGQSKYGLERTVKVILDLFAVKFLNSYAQKPIHIFGGVGITLIFISCFLVSYLLLQKIFWGYSLIKNPLLLMSVMFMIIGFQSILMGLLGELVVRTYYESQDKPTYHVHQRLNLGKNEENDKRTKI
jgi:glycosyltransferase involved in cell wall biosynthesis